MLKNEWELDIAFAGVNYSFQWSEKFFEGRSLGYSGSVMNLDTAELVVHNSSDEWISIAVSNAAAAFRQAEIRRQLEEQDLARPLEERQTWKMSDIIFELYERSVKGEYLGQTVNSELLYAQDLASILGVTLKRILLEIETLHKLEKIGLNGMILISYETELNNYKSLEASTGHKKLSISDFGWWSCVVCKQHGDDYTSPKDFECKVPLEG